MKVSAKSTAMLGAMLAVLGASPGELRAQDTESAPLLQEIVVSAQRREQRLQDVPLAVSAVSGSFLKSVGAEGLEDYAAFVPGVNLASAALGERGGQNITLRGISNARLVGTDASSLSATTGFYIDDIPVTPVDVQLFDISRVEVLRGPQGTLYGAASMGGAVKLYMNQPDTTSFTTEAEARLEWLEGGGEGGSVSGAVNLPLVEGKLAVRAVGQWREVGGYIDTAIVPLTNTVPNSAYPLLPPLGLETTDSSGLLLKNTNTVTASGARLALRYTPTDRLAITPAVLWQKTASDDQSTYNASLAYDRVNEKAALEPTSSEITLSSLNVSYDFGPVTLTSDSGFYTRTYEENLDRTLNTYRVRGGAAVLGPTIPAIAYGVNVIDWKTFTQELRLQSNNPAVAESWYDRLNWVVGAFLMDETRDGSQYLQAPGWGLARPANPMPVARDFLFANTWHTEDKNEAAYADATFAVTDKLTVAAGIRYFDQSIDQVRPTLDAANPVIPRNVPIAYAESGTTPRYNVSYKLGQDYLVYATVADGFRLGGGAAPLNYIADPQCQSVVEDNGLEQFAAGQFKSDTVRNYELGLKSTFASGRIVANVAVYRIDWTNLQQQIALSAFPGSLCNRVLTANVGAAKSEGVELELTAELLQDFLLQASASIMSSRITDPGAGVTTVQDDGRIQNVPDETYSLVASYSVPLTIRAGARAFMRGDVRYVGDRNAAPEPLPNALLHMDSYTLIGARVGVEFENFSVALYGENLLDEIPEYNATVRAGVSEIVNVTTAKPRTVGVSVSLNF